MAIELQEDNDYIIPPGLTSVWITVDNISLYIKREAEGVVVDLYPLNDEMSASLAGCSITFTEAEPQADSQ